MKRSSIEILSNLFKVSPSYLMCIEEEPQAEKRSVDIPLLSNFNTDIKTSIKNNFIKNITINDSLPENTFALLIDNNAMLPLLGIDDIAVITEDFTFESGQTCLILTNNIVMIRKVIKTNDGFELQAMNPYYPIEKAENIKIYGKVIRVENTSAFK